MEFGLKEKTAEHLPWVIFQLTDQYYAINSAFIQSIDLLSAHIVSLPKAEPYVKGVVKLRNYILPVLDLRAVFGLVSLEEECEAIVKLLERQKNNLLEWVNELESSIRHNRPFVLPLEPDKCKFGIWFDSILEEMKKTKFEWEKLKDYHERMHTLARQARVDEADSPPEPKNQCLQTINKQILPKLLELLDQGKQDMGESEQSMMLLLAQGETRVGLLVDEIAGVWDLVPKYSKQNAKYLNNTHYIEGISTDNQLNRLILLLDVNALFALGQEVEIPDNMKE